MTIEAPSRAVIMDCWGVEIGFAETVWSADVSRGWVMRIIYRQGEREHSFSCDADSGRILGVIARALPAEVGVLCHNGTARWPITATRAEVFTAARAVLSRLDADPGLPSSLTPVRPPPPRPGNSPKPTRLTPGIFSRGAGFSGIRFADTPAAQGNPGIYAIKCGPGQCDLEEIAIGADGRGAVVAITDLRDRAAVETANMGVLKLHRKASKTRLRAELEALLSAVEGWPAGAVNKVLDVGGADED